MTNLVRDIRFAARTLRRSPGYTAAGLVTLAFCIGANTAVFSIVSGILLAPLPFQDPDHLVRVRETSSRGRQMNVAWRNFADWRDRNRTFEELVAFGAGNPSTVLGAGEPLRVGVSPVSEGFLRALGIQPAVGRAFLPEDHVPGADAVVLVSNGFWRTHLGGEPELDGLRLTVNGHDASIVGVLPPDFAFPAEADIWIPLELSTQSESRTAHNWMVIGRLRSGIDIGAADGDLDRLTEAFLTEDPGAVEEDGFLDFFPVGAAAIPLREALVGDSRRPLGILLGASILVLLVGCTNLASATLARGTGRQREYAVRLSLGAGRAHLMRQLLVESVLLAITGGAIGVLVAAGALRALPALAPAGIPRLADIHLSPTVLLVAFGVTLLTAFVFGLLPALRSATGGHAIVVRGGAGAGIGGSRHRLWKGLIALEVALALTLLVGAGLLMRSFWMVLSVHPGFRTEQVLTATVSPPSARYETPAARRQYYDALLRELESLTGVEDIGMVSAAPPSGTGNGLLAIRDGASSGVTADYHVVSSRYFATMGIPLVAGRNFDPTDHEDAPHSVVVNRAFAALAWPGEDAIGKQMTGGGMDDYWNQDVWATVIGVVGDIHQRDVTRDPEPAVYFSYRQRPFRTWSMTAVLVPTQGDAATLAPTVREAVRRTDDDVPVLISTLEESLSEAHTPRRFTMLVLVAFAAIALGLAFVGIWGVVAYAVARRTREIGIRMALGAEAGAVRRKLQAEYMRAALLGTLTGLVLSLALTRVMQTLLFDIRPTDPITFASVIALLGGAAWLASFIPALRSTRMDPVETLRAE